jgi:hypothetical protein
MVQEAGGDPAARPRSTGTSEVTDVLREMLLGTAARAVGTVALNAATYADMAIRARPPSNVPAEVAGALAEKAGVDLGSDETEQNRESGLGALSGYVVGLGVGTAFGLIRPLLGDVSVPRAGVALGLAAMAGSDVPAAALGATDPTTWGLDCWASDVVPYLAFGLASAIVHAFFTGA